jgi:hypothetical protein
MFTPATLKLRIVDAPLAAQQIDPDWVRPHTRWAQQRLDLTEAGGGWRGPVTGNSFISSGHAHTQ